MRKSVFSIISALLIFLCLLNLLPVIMLKLPVKQSNYLRNNRPDWVGAMRVWVCATWQPGKGNFLSWLSSAARAYEKQNPGVFFEFEEISPENAAARILARDDLPDVIISGLGMIPSPEGLLYPVEGLSVRDVFAGAASYEGEPYAVPLCAGGYTIMINDEKFAAAAIGEDASLADMLSGLYSATGKGSRQKITYAIDCAATQYISPAAALQSVFLLPREAVGAVNPRMLQAQNATVWADFVLDQAAVMYVGTQKQVCRLDEFIAGGNGFAYSCYDKDPSYTDQVLMAYTLLPEVTGGEDPEQRIYHISALLSRLISPEWQEKLSSLGVFPVIELPALYGGHSAMGRIESSLGGNITIPNAFAFTYLRADAILGEKSSADTLERLVPSRALLDKVGDSR